MLDNVIYHNVQLPRDAFSTELFDELMSAAMGNVRLSGEGLIFRHLIVQMKMTPLPRFLEVASPDEANEAISSLGRCIKNNAAANIFNKDLDGRNYGVGPTRRVYLFDYDAVEPLSEVKVRTNADRMDGEEDIPDWFFEEGFIFLPEEIELHLRLQRKEWRQAFRPGARRSAHHRILGEASGRTRRRPGAQSQYLRARMPAGQCSFKRGRMT